MTQVGNKIVAQRVAECHFGLNEGYECIGYGSHRTVYVDWDADIVYKVGLEGANRQEVRTLADLRRRGVAHAPAATLYEPIVTDEHGDKIAFTVVAMPYLPDDGSVPRPYPIQEGSADFNPAGNVHANCGQLWLIDAGGL